MNGKPDGRVVFDAARETDLYKPDRRIIRQIVIPAAVVLALLAAALLLMNHLGRNESYGSAKTNDLTLDGLVYERMAKVEEIHSLGLQTPLDADDCGQAVVAAAGTDADYSAVYEVAGKPTRALRIVEKSGRYDIYRFAEFASAKGATAADIFGVCADETRPISAEIVDAVAVEGRTLYEGGDDLLLLTELLAAMEPDPEEEAREQQVWDAILTLRYENGMFVSFNVDSARGLVMGCGRVFRAGEDVLAMMGL